MSPADETKSLEDSSAIMAQSQEETRRAVLAEMRQPDEIAGLAGRSAEKMRGELDRWKNDGLIFSVEHDGTEYFPLFALDSGGEYRPYPAVAEVLRILNASNWGSNWAVAAWFVELNSFLDGQRPQELLAFDPERVINAAKDAAASVTRRI
jgi:hypothetical protein